MRDLERLARNIENSIPVVIRESNAASLMAAQDLRQFAIYFSSGTFSSKQLARMGHPYGLGGNRGPIPYGASDIINEQTGQFKSRWRVYVSSIGVGAAGGLLYYAVDNTDPVANFLQFGTRKMIARPLDKLMKTYGDSVLTKRLQDALIPILQRAFLPQGA